MWRSERDPIQPFDSKSECFLPVLHQWLWAATPLVRWATSGRVRISLPRQVWRKTDWSAGMLQKLKIRPDPPPSSSKPNMKSGWIAVCEECLVKVWRLNVKIFDSGKASPVAGWGYFEEAIRGGGQVAIGKWASGGGSHIIGNPLRPASTWKMASLHLHWRFSNPGQDIFQCRHQVYHSRITRVQMKHWTHSFENQ